MRLALRCPLSFVNGSLSTLRLAHVLVWVALKLCLKPRDLLSLPHSLLALCSSWYRSLDSCPAWLATPLFFCSQPHTRTHSSHTHIATCTTCVLCHQLLCKFSSALCVFVESGQFRIDMINWKYLRRVHLFAFGFSILRSQQCFDILLILKTVCYDNGLVRRTRTCSLVKIVKMEVRKIEVL